MFGSRILILVPHPDDEIVGFCAALRRAQEDGAKIFTLYLTHGCIERAALWPWQRHRHEDFVARRLCEAENAACFLDITPIGFTARPARHLWREMRAVFEEIKKAVKDYAIDQLWTPAYEGGHPDHDALNAVASVFKRGGLPVLEFSEYNLAGGKKRSQKFSFPNGTETVLDLSKEEQRFKQDALAYYESEQRNLGYVETKQESFRPLAAYDYAKPPHDGTLWYARFQWVPFRHPRVDFTKPQDVCDAISSFLFF